VNHLSLLGSKSKLVLTIILETKASTWQVYDSHSYSYRRQ